MMAENNSSFDMRAACLPHRTCSASESREGVVRYNFSEYTCMEKLSRSLSRTIDSQSAGAPHAFTPMACP